MRLFGHASKTGATMTDMAADRIHASLQPLAVDARITKLSAYIDGLGSGSGEQQVRGVIHDAAHNLLAVGDEVLLAPDNSDAAWVDLPLPDDDLTALSGSYYLGIQSGPPTNSWRLGILGSTGGVIATDTYADGPSNPMPATSVAGVPALFATYITSYAIPSEMDDFWRARLGFTAAQQALATEEADSRTRQLAFATWHGTYLDAEDEGTSFALVQSDSPLADFVGERIKVSWHNKSVVAFVARDTDLDLDTPETLSLSRRLWMELTEAAVSDILVKVEVVGKSADGSS